jgi:hypothetical protein
MAEWKPSLDGAWEYSHPPYRGVLAAFSLQESGGVSLFTTYIATPRGRHCAPVLLDTIKEAKTWVEQEIQRLVATVPADDESPS